MRTLSLAALAASLLLAGCSRDVDQHAHPQPSAPAVSSQDLESQDRDFLERASEGNNAEVAMGKIVGTHAMRPEVIAFGQMMVADHGAAQEQLGLIAEKKHIALTTSLGEQQAGYDRLADRRLDPFDREFARVMIGAHQDAVELFKGEAQNGVDPDLKAFAAATLPKIEAHLAQAVATLGPLAQQPQDLAIAPPADATAPPPNSPTQKPPYDATKPQPKPQP